MLDESRNGTLLDVFGIEPPCEEEQEEQKKGRHKYRNGRAHTRTDTDERKGREKKISLVQLQGIVWWNEAWSRHRGRQSDVAMDVGGG